MIVDGCRGVGCDCSRCGHWPGYEVSNALDLTYCGSDSSDTLVAGVMDVMAAASSCC